MDIFDHLTTRTAADVHPADLFAPSSASAPAFAASPWAKRSASGDPLAAVALTGASGSFGTQLAFGFAGSAEDTLHQARAARDRYEAGGPPLRNYGDWAAYWNVIRSLGLAGETSTYMRENLRLFLEPMGRPRRPEVVGAVAMPKGVAAECVRLMRIEGGYARRVARRALLNPATYGREDLRAALPPKLRHLPDTWLCKEVGNDFDAIPGGIILRLTMIDHPRLRTAAILEVLLLCAEGTRAGLDVPTAAFERWDDAFAEAGMSPDSATDWLAVAQRYCIARDLQPLHAIGPRISAFERWGAAEGRRALFEREHRDLGAALRAARLPALPDGRASKSFLRDFRKLRDKYGIDCTNNRKYDADNLADNFASRLAAAQLRARQATRLWREAEAGAAALRASPGLDWLGFSWTEEVVSPLGSRRNRLQSIRMEAVYVDILEAELESGFVQSAFRFIEDEVDGDGGSQSCPGGRAARSIVFRFVEVCADDGGAGVPPWWVGIFQAGVLLGASRLDVGLREARRAAMLKLRVKSSGCGPAGLVGPDGPDESRLFQRALNAGVVLVSAEPFGHAMAIAAVAMRTIAVTFARVSEMLQMVRRAGLDAWRTVDVPGFGRREGWMAIPKGETAKTCFLIYDVRTLPLVTALTRMRLVRERHREVDVVAPWRALARKVGPDSYVFAFRGRMLDPDDLNYLYRYLMAGIQRVRNHDLRHAAANRAKRTGGATEAEVAFRLKHAGASAALPDRARGRFAHAATYARDTGAQRDADQHAYCDARLTFERLLGVPLSGDLL